MLQDKSNNGNILGYKTKRCQSQTKSWTFSIKMIPSEKVESSRKKYLAKVEKGKELVWGIGKHV